MRRRTWHVCHTGQGLLFVARQFRRYKNLFKKGLHAVVATSPDARSEKVEHDAPELMREYGSSNFWGSAIDDSLVPDDI